MKTKWHIFNLVITLLSVAGIYLINSGITGLKSVGEVGNRNEYINLTLPPGFIFSIWGPIYLGFILFAFQQFNSKARRYSKFENSRNLITLSIFLNLVWVTLVGFELFILPFLLQWVMMVIALWIVDRVMKNVNAFFSKFEQVIFIAF